MQAKVTFVFFLDGQVRFFCSKMAYVIIGYYDNQNSCIAKVLAENAMKKSHMEFHKML